MGGEQMGKQLGEGSAGEANDWKGRKGRRVKREGAGSGLAQGTALQRAPRDGFASSLGSLLPLPSSSGLSGGQGLFILPPHLWSQSPLNTEHQLAAFSELQRVEEAQPSCSELST